MMSIFGISFTDEGIFLGHLVDNNEQKELLYTGKFDYPFKYRDDILFDELNILKLSDIIVKQKEERDIEELIIHFVLPYKFAYLKRIGIPKNADSELNRFQIEWDLSAYLAGDLSDYKVIKTDHVFEYSNYNEQIVLAIRKSLIKTIAHLANSCNAKLGAIVLNNFAVESFIQNYNLAVTDNNQLIFRIGKNSIETHFYVGGHYHSSIIDNVNLISEETDPTQKIINSLKENHKYFLNLCEKLPNQQNKTLSLMIYGTNLTVETFAKIKSNFSSEINKLEIEKYPEYLSNSHNYIEALGATL